MRSLKSLQARLLVNLLLSALLTSAVIGTLAYREALQENQKLFDYHLRQVALSMRDQGVADETAPEIANDETDDVLVQIWTTRGTLIYVSNPARSLPERTGLGYADLYADGQRWRCYSMLVRDRVVEVAQPYRIRSDLAAEAALRSLRPFLAFIPLLALQMWILIRRALRPLRRLEKEVTDRDARSLAPVSQADLPSEVVPIARAINSLFSRLQRAFQVQRAFVADAAHELRSPMTALKLQLGLLAGAQDEQERSDAMASLNHGVERASRLIEQLLTAARAELGESTFAPERVDLSATMRRAVADIYPLAQARRIEIGMDAPDHVYVWGDASQLYVLMRNLLDNAIRYTPEEGTVAARIAREDENICLYVDDNGPGIPVDERQRVFRRFYRGRTMTQGGNGLGLAIVKNIVDLHKGTIRMQDSPLGGLCVFVCLKEIAGEKAKPPAGSREASLSGRVV